MKLPDVVNEDTALHENVLATSRFVYPTSRDTVVKIPRAEGAVEPNEREVANWEQFGDSRIMAPIVNHADDYSWIEMKRCRRLEQGQDDHLVDVFMSKLSEYDIPNIRDLHIDNIGILPENGEIVCLDYAITS